VADEVGDLECWRSHVFRGEAVHDRNGFLAPIFVLRCEVDQVHGRVGAGLDRPALDAAAGAGGHDDVLDLVILVAVAVTAIGGAPRCV
jgi:hypothetical protein